MLLTWIVNCVMSGPPLYSSVHVTSIERPSERGMAWKEDRLGSGKEIQLARVEVMLQKISTHTLPTMLDCYTSIKIIAQTSIPLCMVINPRLSSPHDMHFVKVTHNLDSSPNVNPNRYHIMNWILFVGELRPAKFSALTLKLWLSPGSSWVSVTMVTRSSSHHCWYTKK